MFDFVRKHNRLMQFLLLLLVFPAFVAISFYGYSQSDAGSTVAKVDGEAITQTQWDQAVQRRGQMLRQRDPSFDVSLLETPEQKYRVLDELVRQQVLQTAVAKLRLHASDAQVASTIAQDPVFAGLKDAKGNMDMQQYQALLASNGVTPAQYEAQVRQKIGEQELQMSVYQTAVTVAALRDVLLQAALQSRQVQLARFASADYLPHVKLTEAQLEKFYQDHSNLFKTPETADVQYVVLTPEAVMAQLNFTDDQLRSYFEQNKAKFAGQEERRVSHILIAVDPQASAADKAKAKAKAEAVLAQVKAKPESFAAIAKAQSQDAGSAPAGGDLGYMTHGAMANPSFDDAVFALAKGKISDVVESPAGFHIIEVTDIRGSSKSFEEVKPAVLAALKAEQGGKKYAEMSEKFRDAVEDQDDLAKVAKQFNLTVKTATGLQRRAGVQTQTDPVLGNAKFLQAIFTADALAKKHNTEAVDLGSSQLASAHVTAHQAASTKPFASVKEQVQAMATAEEAQAMAVRAGQAKLTAWKGGAAAALDPAVDISRQKTQNLSPALVDAIMKTDASQLPVWTGVTLPNHGGYVIAKIEKISPPAAGPELDAWRGQLVQMEQGWLSAAETKAFVDTLRANYNAKISVPQPKPDASQAAAQAE